MSLAYRGAPRRVTNPEACSGLFVYSSPVLCDNHHAIESCDVVTSGDKRPAGDCASENRPRVLIRRCLDLLISTQLDDRSLSLPDLQTVPASRLSEHFLLIFLLWILWQKHSRKFWGVCRCSKMAQTTAQATVLTMPREPRPAAPASMMRQIA
jgi:hypothetical protein